MGLSIASSTMFSFENKENLKNTAKAILSKTGADSKTTSEIISKTLFEGYNNSQLFALKAATQITINKSLDESLKYLKANAHKKHQKQTQFGDLWKILETNNEKFDDKNYQGDFIDFNIDLTAKNIFAA